MTQVFEANTTVTQWDEDYYHPIALQLYDWAIADLLQHLGVESGATVLDAGCGPGVHSIRVAKAGHRVCAIDLSQTMLAQAQKRSAVAQVSDQIEFSQQDLTQLDLPDQSFRYVFSWGVVIHIPEAEKALDELARIVEPGGKLALYITNQSAIDHKIEGFLRWILRKPLEFIPRPLGDGIWYDLNDQKLWVWRFETGAIADYLAQKGFKLTHRHIGEFSEIQRRMKGWPRFLLLRLNNWAYRLKFPARLGVTQLLIFEKQTVS
jgi:ubiquinone/menaquinone biosynthesis C-methylase UbiE